MKKKLAALLVIVMSVCALAACGTDDTSTKGGALAEASVTPSVELVEAEGGETDLSKLPVEEYVTLGDYKNLSVEITPYAELTEEEFELFLKSYFFEDASALAAEHFATEGTVAEGDVVLIDYEGKKDGVAFDSGTAADQTLGIGSGRFIEGFEEGLVGVKAGETVDLELTFPENYGNTELAGQDVVFTVTVKGIASLNDATVAAMGHEGYETVEDYKTAVEYFANYEKEAVYYNNITESISEELLNVCTIEKLPKELFEKEKELLVTEIQAYASMYSMDGDSYSQAVVGMNLNDYAVRMAEAYVSRGVVFQAIGNAEGLAPTDDETNEYVETYLEIYGENSGYASLEEFYETNPFEDVKASILQENVIDYLADLIIGEEAE